MVFNLETGSDPPIGSDWNRGVTQMIYNEVQNCEFNLDFKVLVKTVG